MRKLALLLLVMACATVGIIGIKSQNQGTPKTVDELDKLLRERVPIGSTRSQVTEFLTSAGIEHSDYIPVDEKHLRLSDDEPQEKSALIKGRIYASIRNVETTRVANWGLFMRFYFDEQGILIDYRIEKSGVPFNF